MSHRERWHSVSDVVKHKVPKLMVKDRNRNQLERTIESYPSGPELGAEEIVVIADAGLQTPATTPANLPRS